MHHYSLSCYSGKLHFGNLLEHIPSAAQTLAPSDI
jgi:hypothetical protein